MIFNDVFVNFGEFLSPKHDFLGFSIAKCDSIILQLGWTMFFAISCFITDFIAYSKAMVSSKRDNGSNETFLRSSDPRRVLWQSVPEEISVVMVPTIGLRYI